MFSQAQLNTFGAALERKRISQNTFDEAVRENIEEFDMEVCAHIRTVCSAISSTQDLNSFILSETVLLHVASRGD